jgi:hypothetical protein
MYYSDFISQVAVSAQHDHAAFPWVDAAIRLTFCIIRQQPLTPLICILRGGVAALNQLNIHHRHYTTLHRSITTYIQIAFDPALSDPQSSAD